MVLTTCTISNGGMTGTFTEKWMVCWTAVAAIVPHSFSMFSMSQHIDVLDSLLLNRSNYMFLLAELLLRTHLAGVTPDSCAMQNWILQFPSQKNGPESWISTSFPADSADLAAKHCSADYQVCFFGGAKAKSALTVTSTPDFETFIWYQPAKDVCALHKIVPWE